MGTVTSMSEVALERAKRRPDIDQPPSTPEAGLVELDHDLVPRRVNSAFVKLFDATLDEVIGTPFCRWFLPAVQDTVQRELWQLADGSKDRFDARLVGVGRKDTVFFVDVTGWTAPAHEGEPCLVMLVKPVKVREPETPPIKLSNLDARILEGIAAGESTIHIAMVLYLSRQAVDYRIGTMLRKLHATNRAALVSTAYTIGALRRDSWPPRVARGCRED